MHLRPRHRYILTTLLFLIILSYFALMGFVARNHSQSERFSDESAHMAGGYFMLKGRVPYTDLQFNHQPLPYIFSAGVEKTFSPKNLFLYISRQRDSVYLYGFFWNILYLITFGLPIFLFSVLFEISKYWFSGYKLLGETLAVYPTIYIVGIFLKLYLFRQKVSPFQLILFSISTFLAAFSLLPLWPLLLFLNIFVFLQLKKERGSYFFCIFPVLLLTFGLFSYISPQNFIKETIIYNAQYFVTTTQTHISLSLVFLLPVFAFFPPYTMPQGIIAISVFLTIMSILLLWKAKEKTTAFLILIVLLLSNLRVDNYDFDGFHLIPWVGILIFINSYLAYYFWNRNLKTSRMIFLFLLLSIIWLYSFPKNPVLERKDIFNENYVNFSSTESFGKAIKIMKDRDDRLISLPGDVLIYKVAEIDAATRVLEYFPWVYNIPEYKNEINNTLKNNPPEFIVSTGLRKNFEIENSVDILLKQKYIRLNHVGKPSNLYVLRKKFETISENQWKELEDMLFTKP